MAKGQKRSTREIRKPKKDKSDAKPAAAQPFAAAVKNAESTLSKGKPKR